MATNNLDAAVAEHDAAADSSAPLPSFEERNHPSDPVNLIPETRRVRWTLNGPLETAITVSRDIYFDPDEVPEPYYLGNDNDEEEGDGKESKWHAFWRLPLTEPKVSSLRLCVDPLDHWDYHWMEKHDQHLFLDEKRAGNVPDDEVLYGPLPREAAYVDGEVDPGDEHLLVCCGQKRPLGKDAKGVVVKPAAGEGPGFVTIHDFISTVHPYLMARRDEVLAAMSEDPGRTGTRPFRSETRLFVIWYSAPYVDVLDEADWARSRKRRPRPGKKLTPEEREGRLCRGY